MFGLKTHAIKSTPTSENHLELRSVMQINGFLWVAQILQEVKVHMVTEHIVPFAKKSLILLMQRNI